MPKDPKDAKVMVVEITAGVLRHIRSSGVYANLSGHQVDYVAFISHQGTFYGEVQYFKKRVPLNEIYPELLSKNKTNLYRIGSLTKHKLKQNSKVPRGRKRIVSLERFLNTDSTAELFRNLR